MPFTKFISDIYPLISKAEKKPNVSNEVELRFGVYETGKFNITRFVPGVTRSEFFSLKESLEKDKFYKIRREVTTDKFIRDKGLNYRETGDLAIVKRQKLRENVPNWFLRCDWSEEEEIKVEKSSEHEVLHTRQKERWIASGQAHEVHMTIVDKEYFEVEIELTDVFWRRSQESALKLINNIFGYIYIRLKQTDIVYSAKEADDVFSYINSITMGRKRPRKYRIEYDFFSHPINLRWEDLEQMFGSVEYFASSKADGYNWFLAILEGNMYLVNTAGTMNKIMSRNKDLAQMDKTVFQGEIVPEENLKYKPETKYSFYAYDCLVSKGVNITGRKYEERIREIIPFKFPVINFQFKPVIKVSKETFHEDNGRLVDNPDFQTDGIIYTPNLKYFLTNRKIRSLPNRKPDTHVIRKWKPPEQLTIDFRVIRQNGDYILLSAKDEVFRGTEISKFNSSTDLEVNHILSSAVDRDIIEFEFKDHKLVPIRKREDKLVPNGRSVAINVWNDIHDPITVNLMTNPENTEMSERLISFIKSDLFHELSKTREDVLVVGPNFKLPDSYKKIHIPKCKYREIRSYLSEVGRRERFKNIVLETNNPKCIEGIRKNLKYSDGLLLVFSKQGQLIPQNHKVVMTKNDEERMKLRWRQL